MAWDLGGSEPTYKERKRSESAIYDTQAPWTAARCQRLLRPLSSKIALLRQERRYNQITGDPETAHDCSISVAPKSQARAPSQGNRRRTIGAGDVADQEWAPNPRPRKKLKRTYSSKNLAIQHAAGSSHISVTDQSIQIPFGITIPDSFLQPNTQPVTTNEASDRSQHVQLHSRDHLCEQKSNSRNHEEDPKLPWTSAPRSHPSVKPSFHRKLTDGISNGLDALLKTTRPQKLSQTRFRGSRGLFATCLRKVPDLIAQEEFWYKMEDPESDVDVSSMMYTDLESHSTSTSSGWMPLQQIVRAHGVSIVGSAICEGLIGFDVARGILNRTCILKAYDEAQHILRCLLQTVEPLRNHLKPPVETSSILQCLTAFALASGRHNFHYRQLTWLLSSGRLPLDWIGRPDMVETWNKVVQSITQDDDDAGPATELLRLATSMTYGCPGQSSAALVHGLRLHRQGLAKAANAYRVSLGYQTRWPRDSKLALHDDGHDMRNEKASSTISSLMAVICAIGLLRSAGQASSSDPVCRSDKTALQEVAIDARQMLELAADRMLAIQGDRMTLPLLAVGLVQATLCRNQEMFAATVPALFDTLSNHVDGELTVEEGGSFLCAVADCCARATHEEVFEHTKKMVKHLRHIAESLKPISTSGELCNRMGLAAALEYAERTKHPKHLHWALDVEQAVLGAHLESARRTPVKTPLRGQGQTQKGYRWEGGICEWIAKTPAIALARPQAFGQRDASTRSFDDSPIRIPQDGGWQNSKSSPASSNGRNKATPVKQPSCVVNQNTSTSPDDADGATKSQKTSPKKVFFSHVCISKTGDELSECEPSPKSQPKPPPRLREITNMATKCGYRHREHERWMTKGAGWSSVPAPCAAGGMVEVHDLALEGSEDELSFL
ncbi:MAG: hypothetical protein L6R36_002241 [Xanthoria steineri]|nr:MAG: hypothetical protein L6R36_002241 [Xanthoria steineri]